MKLRRCVVVPAVLLIAALIAGCAGMPGARLSRHSRRARPHRRGPRQRRTAQARAAARLRRRSSRHEGARPGRWRGLQHRTSRARGGAAGRGLRSGFKGGVPSRPGRAFDERMKKPAMKNAVRVLRDYDDPVPPEARELDLVTFFFTYHDTPAMGVDRAKMNRRIFESLRSGGSYVIADHAARPGAGVSAVEIAASHRGKRPAARGRGCGLPLRGRGGLPAQSG